MQWIKTGGTGATGASGSGGSATIYDVDVTITAPVTFTAGTTPIPSVVQGALLLVRFVQDGTGHVVTWGTGFKAASAIDTTALMVSTGAFKGGADGNWWSLGTGVIGAHP